MEKVSTSLHTVGVYTSDCHVTAQESYAFPVSRLTMWKLLLSEFEHLLCSFLRPFALEL